MRLSIEAEIDNRWVETFLSFLKRLEYNGDIGHSSLIGFYADGDGDFRPKFRVMNFLKDGEITTKDKCYSAYPLPEYIYDAG